MRNLLHPSDRDRLAALLRGPLARQVTIGGTDFLALAEAERAGEGGRLCAYEDNARAAELFALPELRDHDPGFADAQLDAVLAMASLPLPCRRVAQPELEVLRDDPKDFEVITPFHRFTGDLSAGVVRQAFRGREARGLAPVLHTGNRAELWAGRRRTVADAEDNIRDFALRQEAGRVVLMHESRIAGPAGLIRPRRTELGTLRYEYEIRPDSPVLRLTVTFHAARLRPAVALRVTSAVDEADAQGLDFDLAELAAGGAWREVPAGATGTMRLTEDAAEQVTLRRRGGGVPRLHIRPEDPATIRNIRLRVTQEGLAHWLVIRHGTRLLFGGRRFVAREDRLLALCADAREVALTLPRAGELAGLDLEPTGPDGLALHALATHLLFTASGAYRQAPAPARLEALAARYESLLAGFTAAADQARVAALGFATVSLDSRWRATGRDEHAAALDAMLGRLLARQRDGLFRDPAGRASLEGHAAALLALARAGYRLKAERLGPALHAALAALQPGKQAGRLGGRATEVNGFALAGLDAGGEDLSHHTRTLALLSRALRAVVEAAEGARLTLPPEDVSRARELQRMALALLRPVVRARGAMLEVSPSPLGGGGSTGAQASLMLALLPSDALAAACVPAAQSAA